MRKQLNKEKEREREMDITDEDKNFYKVLPNFKSVRSPSENQ